MSINNRHLSAVLLILIGSLIGVILVLLQQGRLVNPYADVQFTEIKKNDTQLVTDRQLKQLGGRFLFEEVVDKVLPTVVYISAIVEYDKPDDSTGAGSGFPHYFGGRVLRSVGSGVIISEDGYIVTNNHVVAEAKEGSIKVILHDGRMYEARIVGTDPSTDLAVIKINADHIEAITFGNSNKVDIGEWVLAIGNPFRLKYTVTAGIVSALNRQIQLGPWRGGLSIENFIQTDAAINKGNSGGALVNTSGQLIGINTAIATRSGRYQGYGFAIPSNLVQNVVADLIEDGHIERPLLGVHIQTISAYRAMQLGMNAIRGVLITGLQEGGPAAAYGLQQRDVILAVNGMAVNQANELQQKIAILEPGQAVELKIWRDGKIIQKEVVLGKVNPAQRLTVPE